MIYIDDVKNPLVSIIVITYNSEEFILETLESSKNQSYKNIELIISDDYSTDNTLELCTKWITDNSDRFVFVKIVKAERNTGVPANCNRGVNASKGKWIKIIAGDDLLLTSCIESNVNFAINNKEDKIFISNMIVFSDVIGTRNVIRVNRPLNEEIWNKSVSINRQYEVNLLKYFGNTPTYFINSEVFDYLKYDEEFTFMEDYPFSLNALKKGFKILYNDVETVLYRIHDNSLSNAKTTELYSLLFLKTRVFDLKYRIPFLSDKINKMEEFEYRRKVYLVRFNLNRVNFLCRLINIITIYCNPYRYFV